MIKFKTGDKIVVTTGKDKGREGIIEQVLPKEGKALIPEVNMYKKHIKAALARDNKGGIYDIAKPLEFAKIAIVCPKCSKPTRIGFQEKDGKKVRVCRKCGKAIEGVRKADSKKKKKETDKK